jgi:ATP-dependent Clp protease ATP-binding subunit ClpA
MPNIREYLNIEYESFVGRTVRAAMERKIVGQSGAIQMAVELMEKYSGDLFDIQKPIASTLLLGPTGVGKTRFVEAWCEALHGNHDSLLIVDCGEFQHSHDIAKLLGSPPGYIGHRETPPLFSKERINALCSHVPYTFGNILFDEIEKASDALWHILLGLLDKGRITLGTNEQIDLTRTMIWLTTNAGTGEMTTALGGGLGFHNDATGVLDNANIRRIGEDAARRKFTNEFINRLDRIIAFNALDKSTLGPIFDIELLRLQNDILLRCKPSFKVEVTDAAKNAVIEDGYEPKYNARHLKRSLDRHVRLPLARIAARSILTVLDRIVIDYNGKFTYGIAESETPTEENRNLGDVWEGDDC